MRGYTDRVRQLLLHTHELRQAHTRLTQTIAIEDNASELWYGWPGQATVALSLQERITQEEIVAVRAIDMFFIYCAITMKLFKK